MTTNPRWPEIENALLPGQRASDRPDLTTRVFCLKLKELMDDLTKNMVLGKVIGHVHTVEFQKRGLPHAHILLILANKDKPQTGADCDDIVSVELPDAEQYPDAWATVERHMIHGPCGLLNPRSPCMEDGRCTKRFPKIFNDDTQMNEDGYPVYRRRNNGVYVVKQGNRIDDRWVVPHNVYLCTKYDSHINVEICTSIQSIKYVYKYVFKGHDRSSAAIIQRTGTNSEENEHTVHFEEGENPEAVVGRAHETTLTAWFQYNQQHLHAYQILYPDFPEQHVFVALERRWKLHERGFRGTIGRIYAVSPSEVQKYHLRLLLYHIPGATSFDDLCTINHGTPEQQLLPSFQAAAR
ncbi:hypothetical protein INT45_004237 [Circinella minor]|uniref:Helitron helicase-like domain-containing protein n=1 Tax=Circinella minor TaxID=1195481 RepID=A0A8H7RRB2_9FUNG|nr:hypothetical protein INT45_004237 [Circinella minor]